ncbi:MAG: shikimate dehydrogenase [Armatimonadetes bacterium]|nr:shikimate dehydrogenase [Armatimonadota bacterium]
MNRFAFVVHPITPKDAAKRYPAAKYFPDKWIEWFLAKKKPMILSEVKGIESLTGARTEGLFIACPLTPHMMTSTLSLEAVYDSIGGCCEIAHREGAQIIGLGAFTAVVGDGGVTIAKNSPIPVTTGNSYTVATAIEGAMKAAEMVGIDPRISTLAVVGATGSIGKTCTRMLGPQFAKTIAIGRDLERTEAIAHEISNGSATTDVHALREADVIITVTSSDVEIILPENLKRGAVVCDVSRPRDVSVRVARERPDILVIEGGVVSVPGDVDFGITFGFPPKTAYACMSETMMLALENRLENYTLGKDVSVAQVEETQGWAQKHGFHLSGFRSFERAVDEASIERARQARKNMVQLA